MEDLEQLLSARSGSKAAPLLRGFRYFAFWNFRIICFTPNKGILQLNSAHPTLSVPALQNLVQVLLMDQLRIA